MTANLIVENVKSTTPEVLERVQQVRNKYKFHYLGSIDHDIAGLCSRITMSHEGFVVGSVVPETVSSNAKYSFRSLSSARPVETIAGPIPLGPSLPAVAFIPQDNALVFPKYESDSLLPVKYCINTGEESPFDTVPGVEFINIASIKANGNNIIVTDLYRHIVAEYDLSGSLIKIVPIPADHEFPIEVEKIDDDNYLMAFHQNFFQKNLSEYSTCKKLSKSYLVLVDGKGNIVKDLTDLSRHLFQTEPIQALQRNSNGDLFILTIRSIVKASPSFEKIFETNINICSERFQESEQRISDNSRFRDMKYMDGMLYVLEQMVNRKVFIFDVG